MDFSGDLLRVFGDRLGTSHSPNSPFMVLDPLMNLFTLRISQVCRQVTMHFSYHSLPWHSIFVLTTRTSASTS